MPTLFLPCSKCQATTLHRSPKNPSGGDDETQQFMQCDACGAMRKAPTEAHEKHEAGANAARLVAMLPSMSGKSARAKLEELLYEQRSAIEESEAFCLAVSSVKPLDLEIQDIKVQKFQPQPPGIVLEFTYYALGEDDLAGEVRVAGSGIGRIDGEGTMQVENLTATVSTS
jgi:hypothetical protein